MTAATTATIEHEIGAEGLVAIHVVDGDVRLHGIEGTAVRIRADERELAEAFRIDRGEASLAIRSRSDGSGSSGGRHRHHGRPRRLEIDLPVMATVLVESSSGDIDVDGLTGEGRYRTTSGDVTLRAIGGRLTVEAVSGDVRAHGSGDLEMTARTVSGDLSLRADAVGSLAATTTSGDVRLSGRLAGPGPYEIQTVSGDTLLEPVGPVRVELQTVTGDLRSSVAGRSDGGPGRRATVIGHGGATLRVRTMSGDVRVAAPAEEPGADLDAPAEAASLQVLRSLERGDIDLDEARRRLEAIETPDAPDAPDMTDANDANDTETTDA